MPNKNQPQERLDKYLSSQLNISRSDAKELIKTLRKSEQCIARLYDTKIHPETDRVFVEEREIVYRKYIYIMMNKPQE